MFYDFQLSCGCAFSNAGGVSCQSPRRKLQLVSSDNFSSSYLVDGDAVELPGVKPAFILPVLSVLGITATCELFFFLCQLSVSLWSVQNALK